MLTLRYILALLVLTALSLGAEERTGPQTQPAPAPSASFYLITDYLPPATYLGDPIACCFRVENSTASAAEMEISVSVLDGAGKELKASVESVSVPAKSDRPIQIDLASDVGEMVVFVLKKKGAADVHARQSLRLLSEDDVWPVTKVRNGRLETAGGEALIPVIRKRLKTQDRSYAPLKWMLDPAPGETSFAPGTGLAFVPGAWGLEKSERRQVLGPYVANGVPPLLRAAADVIHAVRPDKNRNAPERLVIALPPEDLDVDTDPRTYKLVLETLLAHLRKCGVREIVLIPPVQFGSNDKQRDIYWKAVYDAVPVYECQSADASEFMREAWWRVDSNQAGVYGRKPNKEGLKKFEQALSNLLP